MTIQGVSSSNNNNQTGTKSISRPVDSVTKNLQNQIANAQKKLQELAANGDLPPEEKMKRRQEIQQEINVLNQQLRQHQIEQRKEEQAKRMDKGDTSGSSKKAAKNENQGSGLSQASMEAIITAGSSLKQAKVQSSVAAKMEGKGRVLESEIQMDKGRGAVSEKKEEELANLQDRIQTITTAQISNLADASQAMKDAQKADGPKDSKGGNITDQAEKAGQPTESTISGGVVAEAVQTFQPVHYVPVDVRL